MTNAQVFNAFINGATSGHNPKHSLIIDRDQLQSYGDHHVLAQRQGNIMLINEYRYSVTTSKQTSQFRNACIRAGIKCEAML